MFKEISSFFRRNGARLSSAGILAFTGSVPSGCAQVGATVGEYRDSHEAVVAFEVRGGMAWVGFGIRKAGKAAEIEILEGDGPHLEPPLRIGDGPRVEITPLPEK